MIDHARLLELLNYCFLTGLFTRKVALSPRNKIGDVAGNLTKGYIELSVDGKRYRAHNLAWFYVNKSWPKTELDHVDLNKANNAISNLREATHSQNGANNGLRKNSLGMKGVTAYGEKFKSAIMVNRRRIHLGVFDTMQEAAEKYDEAAMHYFAEFALTNKQLGLI